MLSAVVESRNSLKVCRSGLLASAFGSHGLCKALNASVASLAASNESMAKDLADERKSHSDEKTRLEKKAADAAQKNARQEASHKLVAASLQSVRSLSVFVV